jgi:hypothetical protein
MSEGNLPFAGVLILKQRWEERRDGGIRVRKNPPVYGNTDQSRENAFGAGIDFAWWCGDLRFTVMLQHRVATLENQATLYFQFLEAVNERFPVQVFYVDQLLGV